MAQGQEEGGGGGGVMPLPGKPQVPFTHFQFPLPTESPVLLRLQNYGGGTVGFNENVTSYFMEVESDVTSVTVTAVNNQAFSVTTVELNPTTTGTNSSGNESLLPNSTSVVVSTLTAGTNNTVRVRVYAEAFQPVQKFEYYNINAYKDYEITVFRRTKSTSADLSDLSAMVGALADIATTSIGTSVAFTATFSSSTTAYATSVLYSVSGLSVTPSLPATSGSVSVLDNVNRATITVGGSTTSSGSNSTAQSLTVGSSAVSVIVTAEDGTTTKTYTITVTRSTGNSDTSLSSLVPSLGWLVEEGLTGEGGNETMPAAAFNATKFNYTLRGPHSIGYLTSVVPNAYSSVSFTPFANAFVNGVPAVFITINGQSVASNSSSQAITLLDSTFPVPSVTEVTIVVESEDKSTSTTYYVSITRAPVQPAESFWIPFYTLQGGPTQSTVSTPSTATGAVSLWLTADDLVPMTLEVDPTLWNDTFYSAMPGLETDYSPIPELTFQPQVSVGGGAYSDYGPPVVLPSSSTSKTLNFTVSGGLVGEISVKVVAYGIDLGSTFSYGLVHGFMNLENSFMTGDTVLPPGIATFVLTPYDSYGNLIDDAERVYAANEIDAFVCPDFNDTDDSYTDPSTNSTPTPTPTTTPTPCACEGCAIPGTGSVSRGTDFLYTLNFPMSRAGLNYLHVEGRYTFPQDIVPVPDILSGTPLEVDVTGTALGVRSLVETIPYRSWVVVEDPPYFLIHARDDFGNELFEGGQEDRLNVTVSPELQDADGNFVQPVITDLTVPGSPAKYRVDMPTTLSATYRVTILLNGRFAIDGSGFVLAVLPSSFDSVNTPTYIPPNIVAGSTGVVQIRATDTYGNWLQFDDYTSFFTAGIYALPSRHRQLLQYTELTEYPVTITKDASGNYTASFSAPTDTNSAYGIWIFALSYPDKATSTPLTDIPQRFTVVPDTPTPEQSEFYIPATGTAGNYRLGILGVDQYANVATDGAWTVEARGQEGQGTITAPLTDERYDPLFTLTQTVDLGAAGLIASGQYSIVILLDGAEVTSAGLPAAVTIFPDTISSLSTMTNVPSQVTIGVQVTIYVQAVDQYGNEIATGGEEGLIVPYISNVNDPLDTLPSEVVDNGGGAYTITFSPAKSGTFSVALRFDGVTKEPVQEFLTIAQNTAPTDYTVVTSALQGADDIYEVNAGDTVTFTVTPKDGVALDLVMRSVLSAVLEFEPTTTAEDLEVAGPGSVTGVRSVSFNTLRAGRYLLHLRVEGAHLPGSPYVVDVLAGEPVTYYVEPLPTLSYVAGQEVVMYIHIRDSMGNTVPLDPATELTVNLEQLPGGEVTNGIIESSFVDGFPEGNGAGYKAAADLTISAIYRISITMNVGLESRALCLEGTVVDPGFQGDCLPEVTVVPNAAFPLFSTLTGSGTQRMVAGDNVGLTVISYDAYNNVVDKTYAATELMYTAQLDGPQTVGSNSTLHEFDFYYNPSDSIHQVQYSLETAGTYLLSVIKLQPRDEDEGALDGLEYPYVVGGAPLSVVVAPGTVVPESTLIEDPDTQHVVGEDNVLYFTLRDVHGNAALDDMAADVRVVIRGQTVTLNSGQAGEVVVSFLPTGRYMVVYTTAIADDYTVIVYFKENPSPAKLVTVGAGSASSTSSARGPGLFSATAGEFATFTILPTDLYGNVRLEPSSETGQSPFAVAMQVTARDEADILLSRVLTVPSTNYTVSWDDSENGYVVRYQVMVAGSLSIAVTLGGEHIVSSPFAAEVVAGPSSPRHSTLSGVGLRGSVIGRPAELNVQARDVYGNMQSSGGDPFRISVRCLSVACGGSGVLLQTASIVDNNDGTYTGSYMSTTAGDYSMEITLRNELVGVIPDRSPFSVTVATDSGPINLRNTYASGPGLRQARAGIAAQFTITAADALGIQLTRGGHRFSAEVSRFLPGDGVQPSGPSMSLDSQASGSDNSIVDNEDGTYTVSFLVTNAAEYAVTVWGDTTRTALIGGVWPMRVEVYPGQTDPAACLLDPTKPFPTTIQAGRTVSSSILAFDEYGNRQRYAAGLDNDDDFSIVATSTSGLTVYGTATMSEDEMGYDIQIVIDNTGDYAIDVLLKNPATGALESIGAGDTYPIRVTPGLLSARKSSASGLGLLGGIVGRDMPASVFVSDTGGNPVPVADLPSLTCRARLSPASGPNAGCTMGGSSVGPTTGICDCINVGCNPSPTDPNRYVLNAKATCASPYLLSINLNNSAVYGSPFLFTLLPDETVPEMVVASGAGLSQAKAGSVASFSLQAADVHGNPRGGGGDNFVAWLEHVPSAGASAQQDIFADIIDNGDGTYIVEYLASTVGEFRLSVQLSGSNIGLSPYSVTVGPGETSAAQSYLIGGGISEMVAGEVGVVTIVAVSASGVRQVGVPSDAFDVSIDPIGNGFGMVLTSVAERTSPTAATYEARFMAERVLFGQGSDTAGYEVSITLGGDHVQGSPLEVFVVPGPVSAQKSALFGFGALPAEVKDEYGAVAGMRRELLLQTRDFFGNDADYNPFSTVPLVTMNVEGVFLDEQTAGVDVSNSVEVVNMEVTLINHGVLRGGKGREGKGRVGGGGRGGGGVGVGVVGGVGAGWGWGWGWCMRGEEGMCPAALSVDSLHIFLLALMV